MNTFKMKGPPVSYLYDKNKHLITVLEGFHSFEDIKEAFFEAAL